MKVCFKRQQYNICTTLSEVRGFEDERERGRQYPGMGNCICHISIEREKERERELGEKVFLII